MMHTVRLLLSGRAILEGGEPIVRFTGKDLNLLLDIRAGKLDFEQIISVANDLLAECDRLKDIAPLPNECDAAAADKVLVDITHEWESRLA
jgi:uncharacterized protein